MISVRCFFFFKQKTAYEMRISDWSSDVCSSDLPPGSEWRAGPSINLATSPDALHWKPCDRPFLRPRAATLATARMGGGTPPILTDRGWLTLWHGVEPNAGVGTYRPYWSLHDAREPWRVLHSEEVPLIEADRAMPGPDAERRYLRDPSS